MTEPLEPSVVREIHDAWVRAQPPDAATFGGPDGNQHFADDAEFWAEIDAEIARRRRASE